MRRTTPTVAVSLVMGAFLGGLATGAGVGGAAVARAQDPYEALDLFAEVLTIIQRDYVEEIDQAALVQSAIEGMVEELDAHSHWLSSEEFASFEDDTTGSTVGIGARLERVDGAVLVTEVQPGGPASLDGLLSLDRLLAVDGIDLEGLSMEEIEAILTGPRGESTTLLVHRPGIQAPIELSTVRDRVVRKAVHGAAADNILYLRLEIFQHGAAAELVLAADRLARPFGGMEQAAGMVLDLRDNPGGLLTEAVAVSDLFLDQGRIVSTASRTEDAEHHEATVGGFPSGMPVAVLVNRGSASASEIVAAALQDTGRGVLVGRQTFGKGTMQRLYPHRAERPSALKLTVGRYITPSGKPVADRQGRTPDLIVPYGAAPTAHSELLAELAVVDVEETKRARIDALVQAALGEATPIDEAIDWTQRPEQRLKDDPQVLAALALLRSTSR
jgi:carboxyl-terminal processing protease